MKKNTRIATVLRPMPFHYEKITLERIPASKQYRFKLGKWHVTAAYALANATNTGWAADH